MRITAEAKAETAERILESAANLFAAAGWENTTTREIAAAAGIATGTLFNYFPCKEAIAAALISDALEKVDQKFEARSRPRQESLEEELFSFIWSGFKKLRRYRAFLAPAAEIIFSPLVRQSPGRTGDAIRVRHLEAVEQIIAGHGMARPLPALTMQLYWTLYLGVFAYWAADDSPHQEDTLALLDQSLKVFLATLEKGGNHDQRKSE